MLLKESKWSPKNLQITDCVKIFLLLLSHCLQFPLALIFLPVYLIARIASSYFQNYGKFINYMDSLVDKDTDAPCPRNTIATTLVLKGDITIAELRALFDRNVLQAKRSSDPTKLRYPELQQHLTTFMGFRIWKDDSDFEIEDHIEETRVKNPDKMDLSEIQERLLNLPYSPNKSPWNIFLYRFGNRSVVAIRTHHVLLDGKSILKIIVESLAEKPAVAEKKIYEPFKETLLFNLLLPFKLLQEMAVCAYLTIKGYCHPWKVNNFWKQNTNKMIVAHTPTLSLTELRSLAKAHGVTTTGIILSAVAGAMQKFDESLGDDDIVSVMPMPKPNHPPEMITNHCYLGLINIPTKEKDPISRLKKCNAIWVQKNQMQQGRILDMVVRTGGMLIYPMARYLLSNFYAPIGITNVVGDREGFSVGGLECEDCRMLVDTMHGGASVTFSAFSHKNVINITLVAKDNILTRERLRELAAYITEEISMLKSLAEKKLLFEKNSIPR